MCVCEVRDRGSEAITTGEHRLRGNLRKNPKGWEGGPAKEEAEGLAEKAFFRVGLLTWF